MKTTLFKYYSHIALAILALAVSVGVSRADVAFYQQSFDNSGSFQPNIPNFSPPPITIRFDYGGNGPTTNHSIIWVTNDIIGNPNSGSAKLTWTFDHNDDGDEAAAFTFDLFASPGQTNVSSISMDIMVDPTSAKAADGDVGYFQVASRDNVGYNSVDSGASDNLGNPSFNTPLAGTWEHVTMPFSPAATANSMRALTMQLYNDTGRNINGTVIIYIDNLTINRPGVTVPPTNSIAKAVTGLHQATAGGQFDRQNLVTVGQGYSWVGVNHPVSYSVTITNYPGTNFSTYKTLMFLVPYTGTIESSADYNEASCIQFIIQNAADGTASGTVVYKVQNPGQPGQGNFYGGDPDNPQNINVVLNAASVLGKWTLTFTSDDNFTITAPDGGTVNTNLISGDGANFSGPLNVYFGPQANALGNIGQEAVYSNFQIVSNGVTILNDNFSTTSLDASKWVNEADPNSTLQVPPGSVYTVSWHLPDAGFSLQSATSLANSASWSSPGLVTPQYRNLRLANIPATFVATNKNAFFRLKSP
jgi:hypothetical protein